MALAQIFLTLVSAYAGSESTPDLLSSLLATISGPEPPKASFWSGHGSMIGCLCFFFMVVVSIYYFFPQLCHQMSKILRRLRTMKEKAVRALQAWWDQMSKSLKKKKKKTVRAIRTWWNQLSNYFRRN
jgi:hypothetical protein